MIVVDASVALAWVLDESEVNHQYAADVAAAKLEGDEELIAPMLMAQECSYRLLKIGRTKRWGEALVAEYGETIDMIGVRYLDQLSTGPGALRRAPARSRL